MYPPYFTGEMSERILSRYGKQTAPIRPVLIGFKTQTLFRVESFGLQTFVILSEQYRDLDVAVKLMQGGKGLCDIHFLQHHEMFPVFPTDQVAMCGAVLLGPHLNLSTDRLLSFFSPDHVGGGCKQ